MTSALLLAADRLEGKDDSPASRRARLLRKYPTTVEFASHFDYSYATTPALRVMDAALDKCEQERAGRLVMSCPPQEGKSTLLRWFCVRVLVRNPETRIGYVSYAANLARMSGRFVRSMIETYSDELGISVSADHGDQADWSLAGHSGGMVSVGIGGSLTGRPVDFLIVDDPIKNQKDANSTLILAGQEDWWTAVARTRFSPATSAVIVQTRWSEHDLSGNRLADGWPHVNIPALADGETPDALNRPPGTYLTSARGRTPEDFEATRKDVGERVWAALYQGRPAPPEGTNFKRKWIEDNRVTEAPELSRVEVFVDPADNEGDGDEAGIVVLGRGLDGHLYVLADRSGHMSVARWFRVATLAALEFDATAVRFEQSLSGLERRGQEVWRDLRRQATALHEAGATGADPDPDLITALAVVLARDDATPEDLERERAELTELWPWVDRVMKLPFSGIAMRKFPVRGDKTFRAKLASPMYETGRVHHVGRLAALEHQMTTWQEGQDSPDRMDAVVNGVNILGSVGDGARLGGGETQRLPGRFGGGGRR